MVEVVYELIQESDLKDAIQLEEKGFPSDEAANLDIFKYRQSHAGDLFLGAYTKTNHQLIGYVCSTLSSSTSITHSSMSTHDPAGTSVCIHSVCIDAAFQRQGVAVALLKEYISRLQRADRAKYERALLITHEDLAPLYTKAGFEWVGPSEVAHGSRAWFEMRKIFTDSPAVDTPVQQTVPPGVWEALQRQPRNRPAAQLFSSFSIDDLKQADGTNKFDLLCPRPNCGSVILRAGVGSFVERANIQIEPPNVPANPLLTPMVVGETRPWWLISPSPMEFENIGFSRPVQGISTPSGNNIKLLACAECDLGPLGYSEEGGTEFFMACERVGYRT